MLIYHYLKTALKCYTLYVNYVIKNQSITYSLKRIKEVKKSIESDFIFLDLADCTISEITNECLTTGLIMSQKNLVLTNLELLLRSEKNTTELINCLNLVKESTKVNLYLILDKVDFTKSNLNKIMLVAEYFDFSEIPLSEFTEIIKKEIKEPAKFANLVESLKTIFLTDYDLFLSELNKVNLAISANLTEAEIIQSLNLKTETKDVFTLIKLILNKEKKQAIALFNEFVNAGVSLTHLNKLIYLAYLNLYLAKQASSSPNPVEALSASAFVTNTRAALILKEAKVFPETYLVNNMQKLADFDYLFKYDTRNIQDVFNFFIMED